MQRAHMLPSVYLQRAHRCVYARCLGHEGAVQRSIGILEYGLEHAENDGQIGVKGPRYYAGL
jgi:hypothetical protein